MAVKSFRLIRDYAAELSQDTLRRLYRRAIFEVKVSAEQTHLQWQQRAAGNVSLNGSLAEGITWADLPQRLRHNRPPRFLPDASLRGQTRSRLSSFALEAPDLIVAEADRICEHVFDLLGSGPEPLGDKIDWHTDFKTGHRWNPRTYYKRIRPAPYPGGYDIKVPWELSRCQHFVRLGQAYWITGDEKYAREFVAQVSDWIDGNPWPWGVNWACTMDVAIRAVNWLWGYAFFRDASCLTDEFLVTFWRSLLVHGRHIYRNLENQGGFTNNHYLADLVGLIYLGILCPEFQEAAEWRDFGLRELWREMFKQVYPDGVSFEASIPYHRLAAELFLSPVILCRLNEIPVPLEVMARLEKMLEFVMHYTRPDGTVPLIGDADNGRLLRLKVWNSPEREWNDHRYLLAIGAVLFSRQDFAQAAGDQWEEADWLLGETARLYMESVPVGNPVLLHLASRSWLDGGLYVTRWNDGHMIVDAGLVGQQGNGGHAHNDTMSFELFAGGRTWITDPGSFTYTANYEARHLFRSTRYHNTPYVFCPRSLEQNRLNVRVPFRMHDDATCEATSTVLQGRYLRLEMRLAHYGGENLCIARTLMVDAMADAVVVHDRMLGESRCAFEVSFHLTGSPRILAGHSGSYIVRGPTPPHLLFCALEPGNCEYFVSQSFYAPSYGVRRSVPTLVYRVDQQDAYNGLLVVLALASDDSPAALDKALNAANDNMKEMLVSMGA